MKRHLCLVAAAALLFGACSKISSVGDQKEPAAHATASTLGWPYTVDSAELITTTVRSGGDVLLSGKNSQKGDDDAGIPLIKFEWEQIAGPAVDLVYRTANTVYFTAPQDQPDNTELRFRLTVYDAKGNTDTTEARVVIRNVPDGDRFLRYLNSGQLPGVPATVKVALATSTQVLAANPGGADIPVTVTMTKLVSFVDRNGAPHSDVPVANAPFAGNAVPRVLTRSVAWTSQHGGNTVCGDAINPSVEMPFPRLDLDDVLMQPLAGFPEAVTLGDVVEPSGVDQARVRLRVDAAAGGGVDAAVCIGGAKYPSGSTWNMEDLIPANVPWDSSEDARAYYDTIDPDCVNINAPTCMKARLDGWLSVNGFNRTLPDWGADAHAVYTNDFDLGFGRDMYMRTGSCDSGFDGTMPVQQRLGKCDVAALVINYADLEAAAKRTAPVIAVAMEYSRVGSAGTRFTKFYIYAPNTSTGEWMRVRSVNLDGRGEQYVPGTCTVCHGGVPASQAVPVNGPYPGVGGGGNGNINTSFLPWDQDALLFSDTDPGFSKRGRDAGLKNRYTLSAQQAALKELNLGAYSTWSDPAGQTGRFALARELLEIWYGSDLSSNNFKGVKGACADDSCVPEGWKEGGPHQNATGSATIYREVFASNCRACHINQVPQAQADSVGVSDPRSWDSCDAAGTHANAGHQVPMACYWQLANAPSLRERLSRNEMPFARRTSDQFWLVGSAAKGQQLLDHINALNPAQAASSPGTLVARMAQGPWSSGYTGFPDYDQFVELDGSSSSAATDYGWAVHACTGSAANPGNCSRAIAVVDAGNAKARFRIDDAVTYRIGLALNSGAADTEAYFTVPDKSPGIDAQTITFAIGGLGPLNGLLHTSGNGRPEDHRLRVTINPAFAGKLQVAPAACLSVAGCSATTSVAVSTVAGAVTSPQTFTNALQLSLSDAGLNPTTVNMTLAVQVTASFSAPPQSAMIFGLLSSVAGVSSPVMQARNSLDTAPFPSYALPLLEVAKAQLPTNVRNDVFIESVAGGVNIPNGGVLTWSGGTAFYTPPFFFSTHRADGVRRGTAVTFFYTLQRISTGEMSTGTAEIAVKATGTYTNAVNLWKSATCGGSSCHNSSGALIIRGNLGDYSHATLTSGNIASASRSKIPASGPPYTAADISNSGLLCWPTDSCGRSTAPFHTGGALGSSLGPVRQWIDSGAYNDP